MILKTEKIFETEIKHFHVLMCITFEKKKGRQNNDLTQCYSQKFLQQ